MMAALLLASVDGSAALPFSESLQFQVVGVSIVALSLSGLAVLVSFVALGLRATDRKKPTPEAVASTAPAAPELHGGIPPEIRAAIAAAVHVTLKSPHRILDVQPVNPMIQAWSIEGRRSIFQSHRLR